MARILIVFVALAVLGAVGLVAYQETLESQGTFTSVANDQFDPGSGGVANLSESNEDNRFYVAEDNVTVRDENGTEMTQPADFEWLSRNGTVLVNSSGELAGDSDGFADYGYTEVDQDNKDRTELLGRIPMVMGPLLLIFVVVILGRLVS